MNWNSGSIFDYRNRLPASRTPQVAHPVSPSVPSDFPPSRDGSFFSPPRGGRFLKEESFFHRDITVVFSDD
jgi:hypothetical protein